MTTGKIRASAHGEAAKGVPLPPSKTETSTLHFPDPGLGLANRETKTSDIESLRPRQDRSKLPESMTQLQFPTDVGLTQLRVKFSEAGNSLISQAGSSLQGIGSVAKKAAATVGSYIWTASEKPDDSKKDNSPV